MEILKICCDASQKTIAGRRFICAGAICNHFVRTKLEILPDSTNNKGELMAVYLACRLALEEVQDMPFQYHQIHVYSDSQFVIYGLTRWMNGWVESMGEDGVMMNTSNQPVANQELFKMIMTFLWLNKLKIHFFNQKGHVNVHDSKSLSEANQQFHTANGFYLKAKDLIEISNFNNIIDKMTRDALDVIDPNWYPVVYHKPESVELCRYIIPPNYQNFIC